MLRTDIAQAVVRGVPAQVAAHRDLTVPPTSKVNDSPNVKFHAHVSNGDCDAVTGGWKGRGTDQTGPTSLWGAALGFLRCYTEASCSDREIDGAAVLARPRRSGSSARGPDKLLSGRWISAWCILTRHATYKVWITYAAARRTCQPGVANRPRW